MSKAAADPVTTTLIPSRTATILLLSTQMTFTHSIFGLISTFRHGPRLHQCEMRPNEFCSETIGIPWRIR